MESMVRDHMRKMHAQSPDRQSPCSRVSQPVHPNTRSFLHADDMCIATQKNPLRLWKTLLVTHSQA